MLRKHLVSPTGNAGALKCAAVALSLALGVLSGGFASKAYAVPPPPTVRYFTAEIDPIAANAGETKDYAITITNSANTTSSQTIKSATVEVPAGFTVNTIVSVSATGGKVWNATLNEGVSTECAADAPCIELVKFSNDQLDPTESVTVTITATAPCDNGPYEWTSAAYNGADFTTAYVLEGLQPVVTVSGPCEPSTGFLPGQYCTFTQGGWGGPPNGGNVAVTLADHFDDVYPSGLEVGLPDPDYSIFFNGAANVQAYLPAGSTPGALTGDATDPTSTSSGVFGGQVTALRLNVDFNDEGYIDGTEGSISGLYLVGTGTSLDGSTVAEVLAAEEEALGGGSLPSGFSFSTLNALVDNLNNAFDNCDVAVDGWAQTHLSVSPPA